MKHRVPEVVLDTAQIAKSVRTRIEAFLHSRSGVVDSGFSARIEKFASNIVLWGTKVNLTAHPHDPEEIAFHVIDSVMPVVLAQAQQSQLAGAFDEGQRILDLGSGAGFPGLVLAAATLAEFTLVESRRKRASFLQVVAAEMDLKNVEVEPRRAEDIGLPGQYDLVIARAFGDAADFVAIATKALRPGGLAMLYANPSQAINLGDFDRIEYRVARREDEVHRILAVWKNV